jgi:fumarate hydratase, class I
MTPFEETFEERMYHLVVRTSTELAPDVMAALAQARAREDAGSRSAIAMTAVSVNVDMARMDVAPICQDTGMPTFLIRVPKGANLDLLSMEEAIRRALTRATNDGLLRPNSVNSVTGKNEGNLGSGYPVIHFHPHAGPDLEISLVLKGGGCENKNAQYSLPAEIPGLGKAGRDLDGVRKCILHAAWAAQGQGCSPGFLGVSIGGDRAGGYEQAKAQLLRPVFDTNPEPGLAALEAYVIEAGNTLGVGTMGFGGELTVLGCKIGARNRLPASFFVSIAYDCWAYRRQSVHLDPVTLEERGWDYAHDGAPERLEPSFSGAEAPSLGSADIKKLRLPLSEAEVRDLKVGDVVLLDGTIYTGRDTFHSWGLSHDAPADLRGGAIYHCGPVMVKREGAWKVMAAGPTTSIREEPYQAEILKKYGLRAVIGKGGMGARTLAALKDHGAVYLTAVGGAAQYYARCVQRVPAVDCLEFGVPEAMWHMEVEAFPAVVTMDSHGCSLHADVERSSREKLEALAERVF